MPAPNDPLDKLFQKARKAIAERAWDRAKQIYLQALKLRPNGSDVHYGLATVFFQLNELTSAAHHFKEVTRLDPLRTGAFINLGAVQNLLQQFEGAVTSLRRGLQLDATRVEGYYNLGVVYRNLGEDELAIKAYKDALRLNPRMADAHLNLANLLMERQKARRALKHYEAALHLRPNWPRALEGVAQARAALEPEKVAGPDGGPDAGDADALVDPERHWTFLNDLHQATIDSEASARTLHQILDSEIEPAVKELSTCLLHPNGLRTELEECVAKFKNALERMRSSHQQMQDGLARLRTLEEEFPDQ